MDMLTTVFNAIPSMVFIVDEDVRIQEFNSAAAEFLEQEKETVLKRRGGDVLSCLHAKETEDGCGHAQFCKTCIIRNSVSEAFHGNRVVRRRATMEIEKDSNVLAIYALITASRFIFNNMQLVILLIEDISDIAELPRMIPICSSCKNIRNSEETWSRVEVYFREHWDLTFSHSLCPACYQIELKKLENYLDSETDEN